MRIEKMSRIIARYLRYNLGNDNGEFIEIRHLGEISELNQLQFKEEDLEQIMANQVKRRIQM